MPSLFKRHNYTHEALTSEQVDAVMASGNATAIKVALYALTLEGVLHQIADHNPPKGIERGVWAQDYADWAIHPEDRDPPPANEENAVEKFKAMLRVTPGFADNMQLSQEEYEAFQRKLNTFEMALRTIAGYRHAIYGEKTNAQVARDVLSEFGVTD